MKPYLDLMRRVRDQGTFKQDRTGTGTLSLFGQQMRFNLADGFPLLTTKKCHLKSIIVELLWFLRGETNIKELHKYGVTIWDEWADENGELGPIYGWQWRKWPKPANEEKLADKISQYVQQALDKNRMIDKSELAQIIRKANSGIDQIGQLVQMIRDNPDSRRLMLLAWNPAVIDEMRLPPCHALAQFYVANGKLSCQLYQRSADIFLGVPFNIASYALLTLMLAQVTNLTPGEFIWTGGDCHLYSNHLEQADLQLSRQPLPLPTMRLNLERKDLFSFELEDFELQNYQAHPHIKAEVAV